MDMLDPLETGTDSEPTETKVIIDEATKYPTKQSMDSDDEQNVVDHLSPQTLLETPNDDVHYSLRSPEGMITYRVLQVEDGVDSVPQIVTTGNNFSNAGVQQVLTSNINGQLYVIQNPNEVFTSTPPGTRAIAPRSSIIETNTTVGTNIKKRDERRRATHNEVERRRRDKINNWITRLSKIIPESSPTDMKGNGHYDGQSKGGILAKACEYILELRENEQKVEFLAQENKQLSQNVDILKQRNANLEQENRALKEMLKRSGIELPENAMK